MTEVTHKPVTLEQIGKRLVTAEAAIYKGFLNNDHRLKQLERDQAQALRKFTREVEKIHRHLISPSGRTEHAGSTKH